MSRRRVIKPLPIDHLSSHPIAIRLPSAGFGALMRLVIHFWMIDCEPMPKSNDELRLIARCHKPTWALHRDEIKQAFNDIIIEVLKWKAKHDADVERLQNWRAKGVSTRRIRSLAKKLPAGVPPAHVATPRLSEATKAAERGAAGGGSGEGFKDT
jgi:hypothetical protein